MDKYGMDKGLTRVVLIAVGVVAFVLMLAWLLAPAITGG